MKLRSSIRFVIAAVAATLISTAVLAGSGSAPEADTEQKSQPESQSSESAAKELSVDSLQVEQFFEIREIAAAHPELKVAKKGATSVSALSQAQRDRLARALRGDEVYGIEIEPVESTAGITAYRDVYALAEHNTDLRLENGLKLKRVKLLDTSGNLVTDGYWSYSTGVPKSSFTMSRLAREMLESSSGETRQKVIEKMSQVEPQIESGEWRDIPVMPIRFQSPEDVPAALQQFTGKLEGQYGEDIASEAQKFIEMVKENSESES